mmetsp:Transcript_47266/g.78431  ORF Transcript_47266/g.78431 Transcript_47266/m.78431 type:complete len:268 (-) Transcript_47266:352-1155(-)
MPKQWSFAMLLINVKNNIAIRHIHVVAASKQSRRHKNLFAVKQIRQIRIRGYIAYSMPGCKTETRRKKCGQHWLLGITHKMPPLMLEHERAIENLGLTNGDHWCVRSRNGRQPILRFLVRRFWVRREHRIVIVDTRKHIDENVVKVSHKSCVRVDLQHIILASVKLLCAISAIHWAFRIPVRDTINLHLPESSTHRMNNAIAIIAVNQLVKISTIAIGNVVLLKHAKPNAIGIHGSLKRIYNRVNALVVAIRCQRNKNGVRVAMIMI